MAEALEEMLDEAPDPVPGSGPGSEKAVIRPGCRILRREQVSIPENRVVVVGGDPGDGDEENAPTIILEKKDGRIARILVQCACGKSAEFVCEYD